MLTKLRIKLRQLYFKDTQFANLMTKRIFNVLLVANPYDAFMLEYQLGRCSNREGKSSEHCCSYFFRRCLYT